MLGTVIKVRWDDEYNQYFVFIDGELIVSYDMDQSAAFAYVLDDIVERVAKRYGIEASIP